MGRKKYSAEELAAQQERDENEAFNAMMSDVFLRSAEMNMQAMLHKGADDYMQPEEMAEFAVDCAEALVGELRFRFNESSCDCEEGGGDGMDA